MLEIDSSTTTIQKTTALRSSLLTVSLPRSLAQAIDNENRTVETRRESSHLVYSGCIEHIKSNEVGHLGKKRASEVARMVVVFVDSSVGDSHQHHRKGIVVGSVESEAVFAA